ncbi:MAG: hypothetical protein AB1598_09030 [Thermodesulfobacteriota bacterium]
MNQQLTRLIRARALTERIVWAIITGSVVFYFFIAYVLVGSGPGAAVNVVRGAEPLFYAAGAAVAIFSVYYRRRSFSPERMSAILSKFDSGAVPGETPTRRTGSDVIDDMSAFNDSEKRAIFLMNELQKASIINLILNELVIIIGFVLSFLSGDFMKIIPFGSVSLVLCFWMFPRPESVIEKSRKLFPG